MAGKRDLDAPSSEATSDEADTTLADTANGENPDVTDEAPEESEGRPQSTPRDRSLRDATSDTAHPTGEHQAATNRDDDPPA